MANLDEYLGRARGRTAEVARNAGISTATLSLIRSGRRRPSPEVAKRIETATLGEVRASQLLGLGPAEAKPPQRLHTGAWLVWADERGEASIPREVLEDLEVEPGQAVVFSRDGDRWEITSALRDVRSVQEMAARFVRPGVSMVDELIAERRAEAAREDADGE
jgi:transcriptional regulator with XRE-family HTH domain